jgi:hypothetical protein
MSLGIGCAWQAVRTRRAIRATPRGSTGSP